MPPTSQDYRTHRRWNPLVYFVLSPLFTANALVAAVMLARAPSVATGRAFVMAVALALLNLAARSQVLRVQDRVIRLEMRLRLAALLPPALATPAQATGRPTRCARERRTQRPNDPSVQRPALSTSPRTSLGIPAEAGIHRGCARSRSGEGEATT